MGSDKRTEYKRKYRAEARRLLKDSYIKRCLKQKFKASEITEKMIIECRKSIKKSRRRRE